jgi:hypothetical protein
MEMHIEKMIDGMARRKRGQFVLESMLGFLNARATIYREVTVISWTLQTCGSTEDLG